MTRVPRSPSKRRRTVFPRIGTGCGTGYCTCAGCGHGNGIANFNDESHHARYSPRLPLMGFNNTWVALHTKTPLFALAEMGLAVSRKTRDVEGLKGVQLPSGWYIVELPTWESPDEPRLTDLSSRVDVVTLTAMEGPMYSGAKGFSSGRQTWEIAHDSRKDRYDVTSSGELPSCFESVHEQCREEQKTADSDVDFIFGVPVRVVHELTGFRYYQHREELTYDVLVPIETGKVNVAALAHWARAQDRVVPRAELNNTDLPAAIGVYVEPTKEAPSAATKKKWTGLIQSERGGPQDLGAALIDRVSVLDGDLVHFQSRFIDRPHGWVDLQKGVRAPNRQSAGHRELTKATYCYVFDIEDRRLDAFATHLAASNQLIGSVRFDEDGNATPAAFPDEVKLALSK